MSTRPIHFVGSLPSEVSADADHGMRWLLDNVGLHQMTALPCDTEPGWLVPWLLNLRNVVTSTPDEEPRPVFELVVDGAATSYQDVPLYRVADGVTLEAEHVSLGRVKQVSQKMPTFLKLRELYGTPTLRHQVSVPSPLDMAMYALANVSAPVSVATKARALAAMKRHYPVFRRAVVEEVFELDHSFGQDLVFQLEAPTVLVGLWSAPAALRQAVARVLASQICDVLVRFPLGAKVVLHLCYGDLHHTSLVVPDSLRPAVMFLNVLTGMLRRRGMKLPAVHIPAAYGDQPPPNDSEFYRPLRRLDRALEVYAGVADHRDPDVSWRALELFEQAAGRPAAAIGTACGLGREPSELATRAVGVCCALADTGYPAHR